MRSLSLKLVLAFTLVSLVGIALVAIMAARFTGDQFRELLEAQDNEALISELSEYYSRDGSWKGIGRLTNRQAFSQRYGRGFVVFNEQGEIIVPDPEVFPAPRIQGMDRWRETGIPIVIDNQVVGIVFRGPNRFQGAPPFSAQFTRLYNSLIIASVGAVLASLILGVVLARTLTRTLRELTDASRAIAKGDLKQQVPIRSQDELGELAASFNQMSSDLAQSQNLRRQMTADIAHELRTPLTVVLGHSEALSEGQLPPDPETFDIIYDETKRLNIAREWLLDPELRARLPKPSPRWGKRPKRPSRPPKEPPRSTTTQEAPPRPPKQPSDTDWFWEGKAAPPPKPDWEYDPDAEYEFDRTFVADDLTPAEQEVIEPVTF